MLRTIIIDDEEHQRLNIEKMIRLYCRNLDIVAQAEGVQSGVEAIKKYGPDLVLLDIRLKDGTGFDLLDALSPVNFKVIFITAYDQYAIKAFRCSALDYLLKPIDADELQQSIQKARETIQQDFNIQLAHLKKLLMPEDSQDTRIIIKTFESIHLVPVRDILYCESDNNYTLVHLVDGKKILVSATLKDYEDLLAEYGFFRAHKSFLVNLRYIVRFEKQEGGTLVLAGEHRIPVASRKRDELIVMLEQLSKMP